MKNTYKPLKGISDLSFGMTREEVRQSLNDKYTVIKRNEFAENTSDYYEERGFFVEYDENDICVGIEFTDSGNIHLDEVDLFTINFSELVNKYNKLSSNIEVEDEIGVTYHDLGFSATRKYDSDEIESILIFSKDYW